MHHPKPKLRRFTHFRTATMQSPHWLQWGTPYWPPKLLLPIDGSPNLTTCLIAGPVWPTMPNGIRIRSAVFLQCTGQTDRQTNRWLTRMVCNYSPLTLYRQQHGLITDLLFWSYCRLSSIPQNKIFWEHNIHWLDALSVTKLTAWKC